MTCPRCGVEQDDGGTECAACGIVFARFLAAQERASSRDSGVYRPMPSDMPPPETTVSSSVVIVVAVAVLLAGTAWTVTHRRGRAEREARVRAKLDQKMTEINRQMSATEARIAASRQPRGAPPATPSGVYYGANGMPVAGSAPHMASKSWPEGLSEERARQLIEQTPAFSKSFRVEFPKFFEEYSHLGADVVRDIRAAQRLGVVELVDRGWAKEVRVLPVGWSRVPIRDAGATFVIDFGRPRIEKVTSVVTRDDRTFIRYTWGYANGEVNGFTETGERSASAELRRAGNDWTVTSPQVSVPASSRASHLRLR